MQKEHKRLWHKTCIFAGNGVLFGDDAEQARPCLIKLEMALKRVKWLVHGEVTPTGLHEIHFSCRQGSFVAVAIPYIMNALPQDTKYILSRHYLNELNYRMLC